MNSLLPYAVERSQSNVQEILLCEDMIQLTLLSRRLEASFQFKYPPLPMEEYRQLVEYYLKALYQLLNMDGDEFALIPQDTLEIAKQVICTLIIVIERHHYYDITLQLDMPKFYRTFTKLYKQNSVLIPSFLKLVPIIRKWFTLSDDQLKIMVQSIQPHHKTQLVFAHSMLCLFCPTDPKAISDEMIFKVLDWLMFTHTMITMRCLDMNFVDFLSRTVFDRYPHFKLTKEHQLLLLQIILRWLEVPAGSGLNNQNWTVGSGNPLSFATYQNHSIAQYEGQGSLFSKHRRDKFKSASIAIIYGVDDFQLLKSLIKSVDVYVHPSSHSSCTGRIVKLVALLCETLHSRVRMEKYGQTRYEETAFISHEDLSHRVRLFYSLLEVSVFGKDQKSVSESLAGIRHLAWLAPEIINDAVVKVLPSLEGVDMAHRTSSSLQMLSYMSIPMIHRFHNPSGAEQMNMLLRLSLPGIDMNDPNKTFNTLLMYCKLFVFIPLHQTSTVGVKRELPSDLAGYRGPVNVQQIHDDAQDLEAQIESTAILTQYLPEFLFELLNKIEVLIENLPRLSETNATIEGNLMHVVVFLCDILFRQCSVSNLDIVETWLIKIINMAAIPASKFISQIISIYLIARPNAIKKIVDYIQVSIEREIEYGSGRKASIIKHSHESQQELVGDYMLWYYLILYRGCAMSVGHAFGANIPNSTAVCQQMVENASRWLSQVESRTCYSVITRILRCVLSSVSSIFVLERGAISNDCTPDAATEHSFLWGLSPYERVCQKLGQPLGSFILDERRHKSNDGESMQKALPQEQFWNEIKSELNVQWHIPSDQEKKLALSIVKSTVEPLIAQLSRFSAIAGRQSATSDQNTAQNLCKCLTQIYHAIQGMATLLDVDHANVNKDDSARARFSSVSSVDEDFSLPEQQDMAMQESLEDLIGGQGGDFADHGIEEGHYLKKPLPAGYVFADPNSDEYKYVLSVRHKIGQSLLQVCQFMKDNLSDNIECQIMLVKSIRAYLVDRGLEKDRYDDYSRAYSFMKSVLRVGSRREYKMYSQYLWLKRLQLAHHARLKHNSLSEKGNLVDIQLCRQLLGHLVEFATGNYTDVRIESQHVLLKLLSSFAKLKYHILDQTYELIRETLKLLAKSPKDSLLLNSLKGALNILSLKPFSNVYRRRWKYISKFLVSVVKCLAVDNAHIQDLVHNVFLDFINKFQSPPLSVNRLEFVKASDVNFTQVQSKRFSEHLQIYNDLIVSLLHLEQVASHWKSSAFILNMVDMLLRPDVPLRQEVVTAIVSNVNNESLAVRKVAQAAFVGLVKKIKVRNQVLDHKIPQKYKLIASLQQYDSTGTAGQTELFIDDQSLGWLFSPSSFKAYLKNVDDANLLLYKLKSAAELPVYQSLINLVSSSEFWQSLLKFNALESTKFNSKRAAQPGEEHFSTMNVNVYKQIFRVIEDQILYKVICPMVESWFNKLDDKALSRAASEFSTGLVLGSKLWSLQKKDKLWNWLTPLLRKALLGCTQENLQFWHYFIRLSCSHHDLHRRVQLQQLLLDDPLLAINIDAQTSSFAELKKLKFKFYFMAAYQFKLKPQAQKMALEYAKLITCPSKQVREMLALNISQCLLASYQPDELVNQAQMPKLQGWRQLLTVDQNSLQLFESLSSIDRQNRDSVVGKVYGSEFGYSAKSMLQFIVEPISAGQGHRIMPLLLQGNSPYIQDLLRLQSVDDLELANAAVNVLSIIPDMSIPHYERLNFTKTLLNAFRTALVECASKDDESKRKIKLRILAMLQVVTVRNILFILKEQEIVDAVVSLCLELLVDQSVEVRILAGITIGGLVRIFNSQSLIDVLRKKFVSFVAASGKESSSGGGSLSIAKKHGGILGLCALIQAYPHDIKSFTAEILVQLSRHLKEQSPIDRSVKLLFASFRKSHQDTWHQDVLNGEQEDYYDIYGYSRNKNGSGGKRDRAANQQSAVVAGDDDDVRNGKFTQAQLDKLEGLLTSASTYYA
ncbi:hypothetical protein MP228_003208 [Amoeboaphelidium protococcarum]|nr:hypothetical protein MP228_003208 [Amoeboaphelidium protococcarum]